MGPSLREGTVEEHAWLWVAASQEDPERSNLQAWSKARPVLSEFDLSL